MSLSIDFPNKNIRFGNAKSPDDAIVWAHGADDIPNIGQSDLYFFIISDTISLTCIIVGVWYIQIQ